jgi:hypothetical protein
MSEEFFRTYPSFGAFILSSGVKTRKLPSRLLGAPVRLVDTDLPANLRFATLLNLGNGVAFGGRMGMPEWVMLDCCLLPTFFVGVDAPAACLEPRIRMELDERLRAVGSELDEKLARAGFAPVGHALRDDERIPFTGWCAVPSHFNDSTIVAFSLFSLPALQANNRIRGLPTVAKAMGLAAHREFGAEKQIGIAQYNNRALRIHTRFGDLRIIDPMVPFHTQVGHTFLYELLIPTVDDLESIVHRLLSEKQSETSADFAESVSKLSTKDITEIRRFAVECRDASRIHWIVAPGISADGQYTYIRGNYK